MGFRNGSNFVPSKGEVFKHPSFTVPDMTMSLREMIDRHLKGGKGVKTYSPVYTGENPKFLPDNFERMDNFERVQLAVQVGDYIKTARGRIQTAKMRQAEQEKERLIIERFKKMQEKQEKQGVDLDPA